MPRILKIDKFTDSFKSSYGLETGFCYLVKSPFYLEIISSYEIVEIGEAPSVKPVWSKIKAAPEDLLSVTNSGCFIELNDYNGFIECRPERTSKEGDPSFDSFPSNSLNKIGKDMIDCKPMAMEERKKVIIVRI